MLLALLFFFATQEAKAAEAPKLDIFQETYMQERFKKLQPAVEKELQLRFGTTVRFVIKSTEQMAELVGKENYWIEMRRTGTSLSALDPDEEDACIQAAKPTAQMLLGKVDLQNNYVAICPENFRFIAGLSPGYSWITDPESLDVVLIHESVHIFQNSQLGIKKFFAKKGAQLDNQDKLMSIFSVLEGHAEYVTKRSCEAIGLGKYFEHWVDLHTKTPEEIKDPFTKAMMNTVISTSSFQYVQGEKFLDALVKKMGYEKAIPLVFENPPQSTLEVGFPERYFKRIEQENK